MKIVLVAAAAMLALSACGSDSEAPAAKGDSISEIVFIYDGAPLHCVGYAVGADGSGNANAALLSCDFVRYHAENPEKLLR